MAEKLVELGERHPILTFVVAQIATWFAFYLVQFVSLLPRLTPAERTPFLVLELTMVVTAPVVSSLLHLVYSRLARLRLPGAIGTRFVVVMVAIWAASRLWVVIDGLLIDAIVRWTPIHFDWNRVAGMMGGSYWLTLLAWTGGYYVLLLWRRLIERERRLLQSQLAARDAQLRALAYQLNPHFLFNTLNSVRALVLVDPARAREMVTRLAAFLRHSLAVPPNAENTLADEIEAVRSYLAIEQTRFEDRLAVTWEVEPEAQEFMVPSLLLQPLVENAIRHGDPGADGRIAVHIEALTRGAGVRIAVSNTGTLDHAGNGRNGIGLDNVRARLQHAFPGRHTMNAAETDGRVIVALTITART